MKYASWYEAATLVKEGLDTAYMAYLDKDYEAAVNALTPEKVQAAAQELLDGNLIEIVMRPE